MSNVPVMTSGMFTSRSEEWATPRYVYNELDGEFGFTVDVAASDQNAKHARYYTRKQNGLAQNWNGEQAFMNPPYGETIALWMRKAAQVKTGIVVCLVHARTDTRWWHSYAMKADEIRLVKGRLKFDLDDAVGEGEGAPFPSCVVIYRPEKKIIGDGVAPIFRSVSFIKDGPLYLPEY